MDDGLSRFIDAQEATYGRALAEIQSGEKTTHWMWFVFPQIDGLGSSPVAKRFAISDKEEADSYVKHPILGYRLRQCCESLLDLQGVSARDIFGPTDALKLRSSMTLFSRVAASDHLFSAVIEKYYGGIADQKTLALLADPD